LSLFVFQELSGHYDADAVAVRVGLPREIEVEIDRAHDAVAEFFVDQFLQGRTVYLHDLVEAVDGRISWNRRAERTTIRDLGEKGFRLLEAPHLYSPVGGLLGQGHLAEQRGGGDERRDANFVGERFEG